MSETVLITGGTGLIGSHLVRALSNRWNVCAPDRRVLDLSQPLGSSTLPSVVDAVVHLAQSSEYKNFPHSAIPVFQTNTASAVALLNWARTASVKRFVLASSGGVYGSGSRPFTESDPAGANLDFYAATRRSAELLAHPYGAFFSVIVVRFFFVYGPGQREGMLFPRLVDSVRKGNPVNLPGGRGARFNPVHVDDAVRALERALALTKSDTINIAGPEVLHLKEAVEHIGDAVGRSPVFISAVDQEPRDLVGDTGKMREVLAEPTVRVSAGLRSFLKASSSDGS